jgi:hypothetical protein
VVFSRTLDRVQGNVRPAGRSLAEEAAAALEATDKDVSIGGAAWRGGCRAWPHRRAAHVPQSGVLGGGTPFLPPVTEDIALVLVETRTFASRVIYERYRRVAR